MKKLICLLLAVVMLTTLSVSLFSCTPEENQGGNEEENKETKTTYTVTVTDKDGNPIKGAVVTFSPKGSTPVPFPTDAEGKATYKTAKEMTAAITSVPAGYEYANLGKTQNFDKDGNLTVQISKVEVSLYFIIKVVDEQGNPIAGVRVQMCDEADSCRKPVTTGADGTAGYAYEAGNFHAQLTDLPEGYTVDDVYAYYNFDNGVATIVLTKII